MLATLTACQGRTHIAVILLCIVLWNRHFSLDALLQRDKGLCSNYTRNALHLVVQQIHQLLIVAGIQLYKHGVRTRGKVALYDLRYVLQALYY